MVLCVHLRNVIIEDKYDVIEIFAGVARIARSSRYAGFKSVAIDCEYSRAFDMNGDAGFVSLGNPFVTACPSHSLFPDVIP